MEKMGWSKGKGLGVKEDGHIQHIAVSVKNDTRGVGCSKSYADNWIAHQDDFNALLATLGENHTEGKNNGSDTDKKILNLEQTSRNSKGRVHYQKFTKGKDLSLKSETDLDCVFGKRKSQSGNNTPQTQSEPNSDSEDKKHGIVTVTSTDSVQDYFKKKMAEKMGKLTGNLTGSPKSNGLEAEADCSETVNLCQSEGDMDSECYKKKKKSKKKRKRDEESMEEQVATEEVMSSVVDEDEHVVTKKSKKKKKKSKTEKDFDGSEDANKIDTVVERNEINHKSNNNDISNKDDEKVSDNINVVTEECQEKRKKKKKNKKRKMELTDLEAEIKPKKRVSFCLIEDRYDGIENVERHDKEQSKPQAWSDGKSTISCNSDNKISVLVSTNQQGDQQHTDGNKNEDLIRPLENNSTGFNNRLFSKDSKKSMCSNEDSKNSMCINEDSKNSNQQLEADNGGSKIRINMTEVKNTHTVVKRDWKNNRVGGGKFVRGLPEVKEHDESFDGANIKHVRGYVGLRVSEFDIKNKIQRMKEKSTYN